MVAKGILRSFPIPSYPITPENDKTIEMIKKAAQAGAIAMLFLPIQESHQVHAENIMK